VGGASRVRCAHPARPLSLAERCDDLAMYRHISYSGSSVKASTWAGRTTVKCRRSKVAMVSRPRRSAMAMREASVAPRASRGSGGLAQRFAPGLQGSTRRGGSRQQRGLRGTELQHRGFLGSEAGRRSRPRRWQAGGARWAEPSARQPHKPRGLRRQLWLLRPGRRCRKGSPIRRSQPGTYRCCGPGREGRP
jgi:hypothetical protein